MIKTFGIKDAIKKIAKNNMDTNSDIDILAVGSFSIFELQKYINKLQKKFGREIKGLG